MDAVVVELLLWAGLIFFLWVLKDTMGRLETEIERARRPRKRFAAQNHRLGLACAQSLSEPIGSYGGTTIYRYVVIDGRTYCFEHVCPCSGEIRLEAHQRCLEPGLLYAECRPSDTSSR